MTEASIGGILPSLLEHAGADVLATEKAALTDEPDGVHEHRVSVRRLRAVLAGFAAEVDTRGAKHLRVVFGEWGRELGVVRDIEVRIGLAEDLLERAEVDDPEVVRRLVGDERSAYRTAHERLAELGREPRARARGELLAAFLEDPGIVRPDALAGEILIGVLEKQARRARKAARHLDGTTSAFHALRKSGRRLRYVAEAIAPYVDEVSVDAGLSVDVVDDLAHAGDLLHDALGDHRDAVLFAEHVARQGVLASRAGENVGPFERIEALALEDASAHLDALPEALKQLRRAASRLG
ncbi:CHAD domain-containing protein [Microbacterium sp. ASV49]|uniref:CHAD domain-containing protein n=1 Tax=Microbacterium candidum TaxID=3041922 RepID=A0ABT7MX91_9MICO|nr:CHAD domain-containing protein [Microbacterium sp. ASV49]MDL9979050.1 CHAD domain-containing protein [Microbacterium sp. ASV49]